MAGIKGGNRTILYIVGGVLAVAIIAGLAFASMRGGGSKSDAAPSYATEVQGAVVVAGKPAPTTIDVYEDLLCPICSRFEANYGRELAQAINTGKVQVRYHAVAILNRATNPEGYSTRAANSVICAADAGVFAAYHEKLFAEQPAERSAGLTDQELIDKGEQVGAPASFEQCVTSGKHAGEVKAETERAAKDTSLRGQGARGFGTPTVTANGKRVEWTDSTWLSNLTR